MKKYAITFLVFLICAYVKGQIYDSGDQVGVGTVTPSSKLHVLTGLSGGTPHSFSKITLENSDNAMMSILTPNNRIGYFGFADPDDQFVGGMMYSHSSDNLTFRVNNHNYDMVIKNNGFVGIGVADPSRKLHIQNGNLLISNTNQFIESELSSASDYSRFMFNGTENFIISYGINHAEAHKLALKANNSLGKIAFWTNSAERFLIDQNGYVGIGTKTPQSILDINAGTSGDAILRLVADTDNNPSKEADNPRIEMYQDNGLIYAHFGFNEDIATPKNIFQFSVGSPDGFIREAWTVNPYNGNFGIGVLDPKYKLTVEGVISAEELRVSNTPNSDYVFEPDYLLLSLSEVEAYIKENKHLPHIPSSEQFKQNGVGLGEMDNMLLRKVEELVLYTIEQQKTIDKQSEEINELKELIQNLINSYEN